MAPHLSDTSLLLQVTNGPTSQDTSLLLQDTNGPTPHGH